MDRVERGALKRLPTSLVPWEVRLVDVGVTIEGVETEGMLVVVEQDTGLARAAGPIVRGKPLWSVLGPGLFDPGPGLSPARPRLLLCDDPTLQERLTLELSGTGIAVELVAEVPAADELLAALADRFGPVLSGPGITVLRPQWLAALETLVRVAPWRVLWDSVLFRFHGEPTLEGMVALVMGNAQQKIGVAVYPTEEDYQGFLDAAVGGDPGALAEVEAVTLHLDAISELDPDEGRAFQEAGLVTVTGLCPRVLVLAGGVPSVANELAQRVLLAVVQAICTLTARGPEQLLLQRATCIASTCLGPVQISSEPPEEEQRFPDLVDEDYAVGVGGLYDLERGRRDAVLVLKLRKRDALRVADRLVGVDGLQIESDGERCAVLALRGSEQIGLVTYLHPTQAAQLSEAGVAFLCVSAGGPKRRRINPREFVTRIEVSVVRRG